MEGSPNRDGGAMTLPRRSGMAPPSRLGDGYLPNAPLTSWMAFFRADRNGDGGFSQPSWRAMPLPWDSRNFQLAGRMFLRYLHRSRCASGSLIYGDARQNGLKPPHDFPGTPHYQPEHRFQQPACFRRASSMTGPQDRSLPFFVPAPCIGLAQARTGMSHLPTGGQSHR